MPWEPTFTDADAVRVARRLLRNHSQALERLDAARASGGSRYARVLAQESTFLLNEETVYVLESMLEPRS